MPYSELQYHSKSGFTSWDVPDYCVQSTFPGGFCATPAVYGAVYVIDGRPAIPPNYHEANRDPTLKYLYVAKKGVGEGSVTTDSGEIYCGTNCDHGFSEGSKVTLHAAPSSSNSKFAGWAGAGCSPTSTTCTVMLTKDQTVYANFEGSGALTLDPAIVGEIGVSEAEKLVSSAWL